LFNNFFEKSEIQQRQQICLRVKVLPLGEGENDKIGKLLFEPYVLLKHGIDIEEN
jgi:hypothetical protein